MSHIPLTATEKFEQALFYSYLFLLCFSTLIFGSIQDYFKFFLCGCIALLTLSFCALRSFGHSEKSIDITQLLKSAAPVMLFLSFAILWQIFQLLPLSPEWLTKLSPKRALYFWSITPQKNTLLPISFYSSATLTNILLSSAYLMMFVLTIGLLNSKKRLRYFLYTLVGIGTLQAIYGSINVLIGNNTVLGFNKPDIYAGHATGTFYNYNHYANFMTFCASAAIALLLANHKKILARQWKQQLKGMITTLLDKKLVFRVALTLTVIAIVLSKSRMGNSAFFFSLTTGGLLWLSLTGKRSKGFLGLFVSMLIIDIFIVSHWFGLMQLVERFENTNLLEEQRTLATPYLLNMFSDFKIAGVGSGNFEYVFPLYNQLDTDKFYNSAHNDYLQFLIELGVIGFTPLFLAVISSFICALYVIRERRTPLLKACGFVSVMSILASGLHAITDFNFQIPANALFFTVIMALPWAALNCERKKARKRSRRKSIPTIHEGIKTERINSAPLSLNQ